MKFFHSLVAHDSFPTQKEIEEVEKEYANFCGVYPNTDPDNPGWPNFLFDLVTDEKGNLFLRACEESLELIPQSIIKVEKNSIIFNGHNRQPPDKSFRFVRDFETDPWRLQVLDFVSQKFCEERKKLKILVELN